MSKRGVNFKIFLIINKLLLINFKKNDIFLLSIILIKFKKKKKGKSGVKRI